MQNPNNLITVHFPNGESRKRNCATTYVPDNRVYPAPRFPAYGDFFSRCDQSRWYQNKLQDKIEQTRFDNNKGHDVFYIICACLAIICVLLYYFFG